MPAVDRVAPLPYSWFCDESVKTPSLHAPIVPRNCLIGAFSFTSSNPASADGSHPLLAARPPALASASHGRLAGEQRDCGQHEPATDAKTVCALDVEKSKRGATAASVSRSETPPITNKNSRSYPYAAGKLNIFVQCYQIRTNFVASQTRRRCRVRARLTARRGAERRHRGVKA